MFCHYLLSCVPYSINKVVISNYLNLIYIISPSTIWVICCCQTSGALLTPKDASWASDPSQREYQRWSGNLIIDLASPAKSLYYFHIFIQSCCYLFTCWQWEIGVQKYSYLVIMFLYHHHAVDPLGWFCYWGYNIGLHQLVQFSFHCVL